VNIREEPIAEEWAQPRYVRNNHGLNSTREACTNPLCERRRGSGVRYCCIGCANAHEKHYEIHESGWLGHSESCNIRAAGE
jgi:hypothetical protein